MKPTLGISRPSKNMTKTWKWGMSLKLTTLKKLLIRLGKLCVCTFPVTSRCDLKERSATSGLTPYQPSIATPLLGQKREGCMKSGKTLETAGLQEKYVAICESVDVCFYEYLFQFFIGIAVCCRIPSQLLKRPAAPAIYKGFSDISSM